MPAPLNPATATGYTVLAPSALDDIRDYYKTQREAQNQLGNEMQLLKAREADSQFNEYMKVMQFDPDGIDPLLLNKAHDAYSKSVGDAVTAFNNGTTLGDKTTGMAAAFSDYEKNIANYKNISKQWTQLRTTPRENLPASARPIQDILKQPIPNSDKIDAIDSYTRIPQQGEIPNDFHQNYMDDGKGNPVPQVSFDKESLNIGVNMPPQVDYLSPDKGVAIKAAKEANLWVATKDKNGDRLSFIPETQDDAVQYATQMVGKDPTKISEFLKGKETSESIYNQVVQQNGGEQKAVTSWAAYQDPSAYPQMYDSKGKIIPYVAASLFKQQIMNGIDNATKKREAAPPQNRTNIYNAPLTERQEFGTPQDVPVTLYGDDDKEKGQATVRYTSNDSFGEKTLGTVTGLLTNTGKKFTLPQSSLGKAQNPGLIKVNADGEQVPDAENGIWVPVAQFTTTVKKSHTSGVTANESQRSGTQSTPNFAIDTTGAQAQSSGQGASSGSHINDTQGSTDVDLSMYVPLKDVYTLDKPGGKAEMLNYSAHITRFVEQAKSLNEQSGANKDPALMKVFDKYDFDPSEYKGKPLEATKEQTYSVFINGQWHSGYSKDAADQAQQKGYKVQSNQ